MATKKPAKLAIGKKVQQVRLCAETGKPMVAVKVFGQDRNGMYWVTLEDFSGSADNLRRMKPIR